jgi:twinkle protein
MNQTLGKIGAEFFESRAINAETAARFGVYTGKKLFKPDPENPRRRKFDRVVPDAAGNVLVFPTEERGQVVAEEYRENKPDGDKDIWQRNGNKRTFWNCDILDDTALVEGHMPLIITEGRIDGLTSIDCGFPFTVSVPCGGPTVPKGRDPEDLDPLDVTKDSQGEFDYVFNNRHRLKQIKRFVLATDDDPVGKRLRAELVRRLLPSRCSFVEYPEGCKDLNAVRMKHGPEEVARVLNNAKPFPVHGVYQLSDYPDLPPIQTYSTGWPLLDDYFKPFLGELIFVLGIPSHGKSAFTANLCANFAEQYGWRTAMFAPEEPTVPFMRDKLRGIRQSSPLVRAKWGDAIGDLDQAALRETDQWINDHFLFIASDPLGQADDDTIYLDWLLDRAVDCVYRYGIRVFVVDPWNEVEEQREPRENQTQYTGRALRLLNRFRHQYGVMVIVLIHPTKEVGREGKARMPAPYDADGSAQWYNKADHFLIVHRENEASDEALIRIAKAKFKGTGLKGMIKMKFDPQTGRYYRLDQVPA